MKSADLRFRMENSCNCCRWWERPRGNDPVYINSLGHVEPWDPEKATDLGKSVRRAMANVTTMIAQWAMDSGVPMAPVLGKAREMTRIDLERGVPISKKELESIERVVSDAILALSLDASSPGTPLSVCTRSEDLEGMDGSTSSPNDVDLQC